MVTTIAALQQRTPRISDEQTAQIVRLDLQQKTQTEIAKRVGVNRATVKRVLDRTRAARTINHDTEVERARAIAVYRLIQQEAWEGLEEAKTTGRVPAGLLAEIRQAQTRIDALLGLSTADPDDPAMQLNLFKTVVIRLIQAEAPDLAPMLSRQLQEAANAWP